MIEVYMEFRKGIFFIRLQGDLITSTLYIFKKEVGLLLEDNQISNVVFNLKQVTSIDQSGMNALYRNCEIIERNGGRCMFCPSECTNVRAYLNKSHLKRKMVSIENELAAFTLVEI